MYSIDAGGIYIWDDGYYNDTHKRYIVEVGYEHTARYLEAFVAKIEDDGAGKYKKKLKNQFRELKGLLND